MNEFSQLLLKELEYKKDWSGGRKDLTFFLKNAKANLNSLDEFIENRNFNFGEFIPKKYSEEIKIWAGNYIAAIEKELGVRIGIVSFGPTFQEKKIISEI
jgi:hypothetical protein